MKNFLFSIFLICTFNTSFSQTIETPDPTSGEIDVVGDNNSIYNSTGIDVKPEFPDGIVAFQKFIARNYQIPKDFQGKGTIYASFVIEKDGSLTDIKILRDLGFETSKEAIRVLRLSPKWKPGSLNNKFVRVYYTIPIVLTTV